MSIQLIYRFRKYFLVLICLVASIVAYGQTDENYKEELKAVESKLREGKFQEGLQLLDEISVKYPEVADIYYAKSLILVQMRDYDGAVESATLAFEKQDRKSTRLNSSHVKISYAV